MKLNDVESALPLGLPGKRLRLLARSSAQQVSRIRGDRQDGCAIPARFSQAFGGGGRGRYRAKIFNVEVLLEFAQRGADIESLQTKNHAMRRKYYQTGGIHIYERHHDTLVGRV